MIKRLLTALPAADSSDRFLWEIRFWWVMTAVVIVADLVFPKFWLEITGVYVATVSNYALVLTASGAYQAALAKEAATESN